MGWLFTAAHAVIAALGLPGATFALPVAAAPLAGPRCWRPSRPRRRVAAVRRRANRNHISRRVRRKHRRARRAA